jgi:hypothetical protein
MFEDTNPHFADLGDAGNGGRESGNDPIIKVAFERLMKEDGDRKIFLPRGSAESRFAPRQYYYLASKTGVVPSWRPSSPAAT